MVNSQQLVSEHEAAVAPVNVEKAKWLGLIEEFGGRTDFCLTALCAYFEKGKPRDSNTLKYKHVCTNTKIYKQRHSHIYSIIHTQYTQCWLNGDSLLVYEDYALLLCHMFGALCQLSTELPASKLLQCNCCLSHLL